MSVAIIIPFSSDDPHRKASKDWVINWWRNNFPDYQGVLSGREPFNKSSAVNQGVRKTDATTLIIADSDCFIDDVDRLKSMVASVEAGTRSWITPHYHVHRLTEKQSQEIYEGTFNFRSKTQRHIGAVGGGLVVVSRQAWDTVHGFDERYRGWGGEDISFGLAIQTIIGQETRGKLNLYHLWHPRISDNYRMPEETTTLIQDYRRASRSKNKMMTLVGGNNA